MSNLRSLASGISADGGPFVVYIAGMEDDPIDAVLDEKDRKPGYNSAESDYEAGWDMFDRFQPFAECTSDEMRAGWLDCRNERLMELWEACNDNQG